MPNQVFLAHFHHVLTRFRPFHCRYAPRCAFRTYHGDVWWSLKASKQQSRSNKHFSFLVWPLLRLIALGSTLLLPFGTLGGGLAQSRLSAKNSTAAVQGGGAKSASALPELRMFCPRTSFFGPKRTRKPSHNGQTKAAGSPIHVRHHCTVNKNPLMPSSSTICPRNGPKKAKNSQTVRYLCPTQAKASAGHILGYVAQNQVPRHLFHPKPPMFCSFQASESPNEIPTPSYQWSLLVARRQHRPRTVGPPGSPITFFEVLPRPLQNAEIIFFRPF